jgi:hypothetical protein
MAVDEQALEQYRLIGAAIDAGDPDRIVAALGRLANLRLAIDDAERELIASARRSGVGWSQIASALGLRSRQAAEQRWLRLIDPSGRDPHQARSSPGSQRSVDETAGSAMVKLRAAAATALRRVAADPEWDACHPRAAMVRASLGAAVSATPGGLYALTENIIGDLDVIGVAGRPTAVVAALQRFREAFVAARPIHMS